MPIPVTYCLDLNAKADDDFPSLAKPSAFFNHLANSGEPIMAIDVQHSDVSHETLGEVHSPHYAWNVYQGRIPNGFSNKDRIITRNATTQCEMLYQAAEIALRRGVACAPTQGFHHAGYDFGGGYCTYNGLVYTIRRLRKKEFDGRVLILDCDAHWGNGTDDILSRRAELFGNVVHESWRDSDHRSLDRLVRKHGADLVLYQAGADQHIDDPYGAGFLTDDAYRARDTEVFNAAASAGIPIAWNLAGGYQSLSSVLKLHMITWNVCKAVYHGGSESEKSGSVGASAYGHGPAPRHFQDEGFTEGLASDTAGDS